MLLKIGETSEVEKEVVDNAQNDILEVKRVSDHTRVFEAFPDLFAIEASRVIIFAFQITPQCTLCKVLFESYCYLLNCL